MIDKIIPEHLEQRTIKTVIIVPSHPDRTESDIFRKSKQKLLNDNNYVCWICGEKDKSKLQVHHFAVEYSEQEVADLTKVKQFVEIFDPYGYGKQMSDVELKSVEDPRCLLVLCEEHHTGINSTDGGMSTSIHGCPFPYFYHAETM